MIREDKEYVEFFSGIFDSFRDKISSIVALEKDHMGNARVHPLSSPGLSASENIGDYYYKILWDGRDRLNIWFQYINEFENRPKSQDSLAIQSIKYQLRNLPTPTKFSKYKKGIEKSQWYYRIAEIVKSLLGFSVFRLDESNNSIYYAHIDFPVLSKDTIKWLQSRVRIPYGHGSTGFITRSGYPLCLGSTDADLRGTVSIEDFLQGNQSFLAFPIIGRELEEAKLYGVVACFFPLGLAFWNKNMPLFKDRYSQLCDNSINANYFQIAFDVEIGRYKVGIQKLLQSRVLRDTITQFEKVVKGTFQDEAEINIGKQAWYNSIITKIVMDMELPLASVHAVREDQDYHWISFVTGELSEAYFLPRVYYAIDKASQLSRWKTRAHIQTEIYLEWIQKQSWRKCIVLENSDLENEEFNDLLAEWHSREQKKDGQHLRSAVASLDVYQYKGATQLTRGREPVQDIVVPLGSKGKWIGALRINCDIEVANAKQRCDNLIASLREPLTEKHICNCITPMQVALAKSTRGSSFVDKKRANEYIANYANILVRWWSSTDKYGAPKQEREFDDFVHAALFLKYYYADFDISSIKESIKYVHNIFMKDLVDLIIVLSIWTWRKRVSICDDADALPVLRYSGFDYQLHKALLDDDDYEDLSTIRFNSNHQDIKKSDVESLAEEFFSPSTFKLIERLVSLGMNELKLSHKAFWSQRLDVHDVQDWTFSQELFSFGTVLAKKEFGFLFLTIFPCLRKKGCYSVVLSAKELSKDDIQSWHSTRPAGDHLIIESIWGRHKKAVRESSHYVEGNIKKYFINRDNGFESIVRDDGLFSQLEEDSNIGNGENNKYLIDVGKFIYGSPSRSESTQDRMQNDFQNSYMEKIIQATNSNGDESTIWRLVKNLGVRWLYVIPIVINGKLVSIINFYSAFRDPLNPNVSNLTGPNQSLFQFLKSYCEDRLTLELLTRRSELNQATSAYMHDIKQNIAISINYQKEVLEEFKRSRMWPPFTESNIKYSERLDRATYYHSEWAYATANGFRRRYFEDDGGGPRRASLVRLVTDVFETMILFSNKFNKRGIDTLNGINKYIPLLLDLTLDHKNYSILPEINYFREVFRLGEDRVYSESQYKELLMSHNIIKHDSIFCSLNSHEIVDEEESNIWFLNPCPYNSLGGMLSEFLINALRNLEPVENLFYLISIFLSRNEAQNSFEFRIENRFDESSLRADKKSGLRINEIFCDYLSESRPNLKIIFEKGKCIVTFQISQSHLLSQYGESQ